MICLKCNVGDEFVGNSLICTHCLYQNNSEVQRDYVRICYGCFKIMRVSCLSKSRAVLCRSCCSKKINTKELKDLIRYKYVCKGCGTERVLKAKSTAKLCSKCCFEVSKRKRNKKYSRTCETCNAIEEVRTLSASKNPTCNKCQKKKRNLERYRGTGIKKEKKSKKGYTQIGTDGAKRNKVTVKFQIVDENTMEAPIKKRKDKEFPQIDRSIELKMQSDWLKNNSVTRYENKTKDR